MIFANNGLRIKLYLRITRYKAEECCIMRGFVICCVHKIFKKMKKARRLRGILSYIPAGFRRREWNELLP